MAAALCRLAHITIFISFWWLCWLYVNARWLHIRSYFCPQSLHQRLSFHKHKQMIEMTVALSSRQFSYASAVTVYPGRSWNKGNVLSANVVSQACPPGLPTLFSRTFWSCMLVQILFGFTGRKLQTNTWWSVDGSAHLWTRTSPLMEQVIWHHQKYDYIAIAWRHNQSGDFCRSFNEHAKTTA